MPFPTPPRTWLNNEVVTDTQLNSELRDALRYLKGMDGAVTIEHGLNVGSGISGATSAGDVYAGGQVRGGSSYSVQFPAAGLYVPPTAHATSERAMIAIGDWQLLQDINGTGTKDYTLFQSGAAARHHISTSGNHGFGTTSPQGRVHAYGSAGGFIFWDYDGLDSTARTIIPDGTGDVQHFLAGQVWCRRNTDGVVSYHSNLFLSRPGAWDFFTNEVRLDVAANGAVTMQRIGAGSATYKVVMLICWV